MRGRLIFYKNGFGALTVVFDSRELKFAFRVLCLQNSEYSGFWHHHHQGGGWVPMSVSSYEVDSQESDSTLSSDFSFSSDWIGVPGMRGLKLQSIHQSACVHSWQSSRMRCKEVVTQHRVWTRGHCTYQGIQGGLTYTVMSTCQGRAMALGCTVSLIRVAIID